MAQATAVRGKGEATLPRTVADDMATTLRSYGVRFAFGIPGNDVLELVRAFTEAGIAFVLAKNEPAAAFMADAVYQTSGAPSVLVSALGPGLSNAMSGIAGASQERSAVLVLAGNVAGRLQGIYSHQVFDHVEMAKPVTKLAARLNPDKAAQQTARALDVAMAHPAGPVLLDCAADATRRPGGQADVFSPPRVLPSGLDGAALAEARAMLACAKRPLLLIGREALHARAVGPLREFVTVLQVPFLSTYKAKGLYPETSPLCLGSLGLSPVVDAEVVKLIGESDLLILAGFDPIELRDAWLDAWPSNKPVLCIDWTQQTHRIFPVGVQAVGDLPTLLGQLLPKPSATAPWRDARAKLEDYTARIAHIVRPRYPQEAISPAALFAAISGRLQNDWLLTVDVGAHRILANHAIACRSPGQMLQSNGLGCMGYALPAAIGAQLVHPDRPVIALMGDGCLLMSLGELAVAKERNLPIVVVVLNDSTLALIKLKQTKMQMASEGVDFGAQRFDLIAQGFGARGVRVNTLEAFSEALDQAVKARTLTVIDAVVDPSEYWEQM